MTGSKKIKKSTSEKVKTSLELEREPYEALRAYLLHTHGSVYAHLGEYVSKAIDYYNRHVLGIVDEKGNLILPPRVERVFGVEISTSGNIETSTSGKVEKNKMRKSTKQKVLKICKSLLALENGDWYPISVLENRIRSCTEALSKDTIISYKKLLWSKRVISFNIKEKGRKFMVHHDKLKEYISQLEKELEGEK